MKILETAHKVSTSYAAEVYLFYKMQPELYFDISSPESGGSLYKTQDEKGAVSFTYHHSTYNDETEEIKVYQTTYTSFKDFWQELIQNKEWFYLHPLFVHPEERTFIREQLKNANWKVQGDSKWQESHQRQWKKVLTDPEHYYNPL